MKCEIDARNLACPQPVVLTKNKMKDFSIIEILVDNQTAVENIKRLASSSGWAFKINDSTDFFQITLSAPDNQDQEIAKRIHPSPARTGTVFVFSSDKMGDGDNELGIILMKAFINTVSTNDSIPDKIIFYNSGVLLTATGSGVVDDLQLLQTKGVEILICGTCVNFYNIGDKINTGIISNMYDILTSMNNASLIIKP